MEIPDELGVLAELHRVAAVEPLMNSVWEIIANRKWNQDTSTAKFLFAVDDKSLILGTNQYRSKDSIDKEHTPFKFNESRNNTSASISARGYGAKLFPFSVQGNYSVLYRLQDTQEFSRSLDDWGMKDWINISDLGRIIDTNKEEFVKEDYRSRYISPISKRKGTIAKPFFLEEDFEKSPVYEFVKTNNLKYFQVFNDYNANIRTQLLPALQNLARIYETKNVELYYSINLDAPLHIQPENGFALSPEHWVGAMTLSWRIGEKQVLSSDKSEKQYYKSEFCLQYHGSDIKHWGRLDSNGSANDKFGFRFASFEPPTDDSWKPQLQVTIPLLKTPSVSRIEKLQEYLYIRIQDDVISYPAAEPHIASKLRNRLEPARTRVIIDILEESLKTNPDSGLVITAVKSKSHILKEKAIDTIVERSLYLSGKHLERIENIKSDEALYVSDELIQKMLQDIHKNKVASNRSTKRKKEGLLFESSVSQYLEREFALLTINDIEHEVTWEDNDATISANHGLTGQAIDTLGKISMPDKTIWLTVQSKDRESTIPQKELDAYVSTVQDLKVKKQAINPKDVVISVLTLAKMKSFNYELYEKMLENSIVTVVEKSEPIGIKTKMAFLSQLVVFI